MSIQLWGKGKTPRSASAARRSRRDRELRTIRLLEQCEDRTLMATALGVTAANALIRFDTATPGTIVSSIPITNLAAGETIVGLDFRPATGELYGLGSGSRLYAIDPTTAVATQRGVDGGFTLSGGSFGFDFNPVPDRVRLTSDSDQNLRLNPNDGTLTATDGTLAYAVGDPNAAANPSIVASAYTNSFGGATATTLYDIDSALDVLVIQNPPNSGTLNTVVGAGLGIDIQGVAGFDIQALPGGGNLAFATLTTDGTTSSLYTIDLTTGGATLVGSIGSSATLVGNLAIVPEVVPSAVLYGINAANGNLVRVNSNNPSTIISSTPITGLVGADTIVGLDFRPATGQLYGLGSGSRLYTINPATGVATQVGVDGGFTLNGGSFGFDFNPVPDRVRLTSDLDQDLRLNPNDGTLTATDGTLAYAAGDPNAAANPNIVASAYTNSFAGSTTTTLYDIDSALDVLVIQNPPNNGTLNTVIGVGLGINALDIAGFDIQALPGGGNLAFAALTTDGVTSSLYTIDLTTGIATQVGATPIGGTTPLLFSALAVAPFGSFQFDTATYTVGESGPVATIIVNRVLGSEGVATVRLTTSDGTATAPDDYVGFDQVLVFGPGVTTLTVQIPIVDDAFDEADLTVNLTLSAATGGAVLGAPSTAVLTIIDNDTLPVAVDDAYTTAEDGALTILAPGVLANDTDADDGILTAVLVAGPTNGTLTLNTDGSFSYTPNANFNGTDSFTYQATDGSNPSNVATVLLTVTAVNDAPVAVDDSYIISVDAILTVPAPGVLGNDTDVEGDALTAVLVAGPANGTLVLNPNGEFTYTPNALFAGADSFSYRATDGVNDSNIATVTLTVAPPNSAPVAVGDSYTTTADATLRVPAPGLLTNDTDADGDTLSALLVSSPANGRLVFNANGSFTYFPDASFTGVDSFTYRATDGALNSNIATVTLTINPALAPTPIVTNDFDGDGRSDVVVYLPSIGAFGIRPSGGGADQIIPFGSAGAGQSIPVPGDFTGSGRSEVAVYLPSFAAFAFRPASGGPDVIVPFGASGEGETIPAPGDYFGSGTTNIAAYLASYGTFAIRNPAGGPDVYAPFGIPGVGESIPAPGDYDGDGRTDLAVYMPSLGAFGIRPSGGGIDQIIGFGLDGAGRSIPTPGDFDGDGRTDLAVYLPSLGVFAYRPSAGGPDVLQGFGSSGRGQTLPAIGNYAGSDRDQLAAYLPNPGAFALRSGGGLPDSVFPFGISGAGQSIPVTAVVDQALEQMMPMVTATSVVVPNTELAVDVLSGATDSPSKKKKGRGK